MRQSEMPTQSTQRGEKQKQTAPAFSKRVKERQEYSSADTPIDEPTAPMLARRNTRAEIATFVRMSVPTTISMGVDAFQGFIDRLFLSQYRVGEGEAYLNAGLVGGLTSFLIMCFFLVAAGYSKVLVAQHVGAKKEEGCARIVSQAIIFAFCAYPLMLIAAAFIGKVYALFGHEPQQLVLETQYTRIILMGSIFSFIRSGVDGFFIGIQKPRLVMVANVLAMCVNIPLNYMLIFGVGPFPEMGIEGAAIATIASSIVALSVLLCAYYGKKINMRFLTRKKIVFNIHIFKKLIRFGFPTGVETFFGMLVFDFFIIIMNSYGKEVGAAVTIAINWDSMFYIPMMGVGMTTEALVGNAMGARDVVGAKRVMILACTMAMFFASLIVVSFLMFPEILVEVFLAKMENAEMVRPIAISMLKLACLYIFFDGLHIGLGSVLRGAGDTKATMTIFLSISAVFAVIAASLVYTKIARPMEAWLILVGFAIALGIGMAARYVQGKWEKIVVV